MSFTTHPNLNIDIDWKITTSDRIYTVRNVERLADRIIITGRQTHVMIELALKTALERLTGLNVYPLLLPDELQEGITNQCISDRNCTPDCCAQA